MFILKRNNNGFTLIEAIIAMAISGLLLLGLYSIFSSIVGSKDQIIESSEELYFIQSIERLMSRDLRMKKGGASTVKTTTGDKEYIFTVYTQNSLTFNKSIPVQVNYYIENNVLYREEARTDMDYEMILPIASHITAWRIETFDGNEYKEGMSGTGYIYRLFLTKDDKEFSFLIARMLEVI